MAAAVAQQPATAPVKRYQGVDKQSSGYKLLASMGWKEGEGLGASRQGIKEHIRVKKKFENWGVGAVEAAEKARDWTTGMLDFHRVLCTLSEITSQHAKRGDSGYESSSEDEGQRSDASDGGRAKRAQHAAPAEAEGGKGKRQKRARKGVLKKELAAAHREADNEGKKGKKKKKQKLTPQAQKEDNAPTAKKRKQQQGASTAKGTAAAAFVTSDSDSSDSDSGSNDSSDSEGEGGRPTTSNAAAAPEPKRVKFATHVGRFKRREAAKMVKHYSTTDLAAILGDSGAGAAAAVNPMMDMVFPTVEIHAERPADSSEGNGEEGGRAPAPSAATISAGQASWLDASSDDAQTSVLPEDEGKWWVGYFGRAQWKAGAGVGASGRPAITVHGFREEDQENLYNLAHGGKTQGRVGLGRSSMPKKVAGTRWAGTKTQLGSDSGDEQEVGEEGAAELAQQDAELVAGAPGERPEEVHMGNGVVIVLPPSKRDQLGLLIGQQAQQDGEQPAQQPKQKGSTRKQRQQGGCGTAGGTDADSLAGLKWRKLVLAQLKVSGKNKQSVSKLSKAIVKGRGLGKEARGKVALLVAEAAGASSKLSLKEGVISMV